MSNLKDEEQLQEALGNGPVEVSWSFSPIPKDHKAIVYKLLGTDEGDTAIVCGCGWAMRIKEGVRLLEAEKVFVGHVQ